MKFGRQDWLHLMDAVISGCQMAGVNFEGLRWDEDRMEWILYFNKHVHRFTHNWRDEPYTTLPYRLTRELIALSPSPTVEYRPGQT